jgi:proton glutamate symport protein
MTETRDESESWAPRVPAIWTFAALVLGVALGIAVGSRAGGVLTTAQAIGDLWLNALQVTIVPLVAALLVTGIQRIALAARGGRTARLTLAAFVVLLLIGGTFSALVTPLLLDAFPIPAAAVTALGGTPGAAAGVALPTLDDYLKTLIPTNIVAAAAEQKMLGLIVFFALLGTAMTRLPERLRLPLATLFEALSAAMLVVIGWVLTLAPLGVLALGFAFAAKAGGSAVGGLVHYILVVSAVGALSLVAGYLTGIVGGGHSPLRFARALLPVQAVALATQSSLASLPAMLAAVRTLGVREATADFVLPLAVTLFRMTSPIMNLAVVIYVARLTGTPLPAATMAIGVVVAVLANFSTVSLPGTISYITTIAPIGIAMGVPIAPLGLLVAVELLPDLMRTVGNVTIDTGLTAAIDRRASAGETPVETLAPAEH